MFEIQTRQKTDVLFEFSEPLDLLGLFVSPVREVSGYAKITILAVADQPFGLNVEEAVSVADDGTGRFVQTDATITAALADRFYPSSKKCSLCGKVKAELPLEERTFRCDACGLVLDRDENAAINLNHVAASETETLNACGEDVRPCVGRQTSGKQEPNAIFRQCPKWVSFG